jgi:hypothetical protein
MSLINQIKQDFYYRVEVNFGDSNPLRMELSPEDQKLNWFYTNSDIPTKMMGYPVDKLYPIAIATNQNSLCWIKF